MVATAIHVARRVSREVLRHPGFVPSLRTHGLTVCQLVPSPPPEARGPIAAPAVATARPILTLTAGPPRTRSRLFELTIPAFRSGSPMRTKTQPRPVPVPAGNGCLTLVWKTKLRLGLHTRVIPLRPRFEDPLRLPPRRPVQQIAPASPFERLSAIWYAAPLWCRKVAALLVLGLVALAGFGHLKSSGSIQKANDEFITGLRERAAIDLYDDFRSGLSQWTGPSGWANTWSYDATGFARPGRLALLASSMPMSDYRLEFLAQIDKKAVAWVFRASDSRNYYVYKLVESKRGIGSAYSIVRYAVINGRERSRLQLPLPVTETAKTMFRVRQEIRGDEFTTYLDGQVIDTWSDSALTHGGFGFFADPGETAYIRWVNVAYQDDMIGRVCAYLVPGKYN